ncbi:uncharacterized protein LOC130644190 [Hydractinia symbiolongicarpus]|uniref:uncharacterized protein LOC130644190 n=1 Tax=Hydractinia symbiolongicarpus TaxID=13093 RepID=UPI0025507238|nr:uncharacterized protein LOC130644190 [Hydractinia symbiolongicarpus]
MDCSSEYVDDYVDSQNVLTEHSNAVRKKSKLPVVSRELISNKEDSRDISILKSAFYDEIKSGRRLLFNSAEHQKRKLTTNPVINTSAFKRLWGRRIRGSFVAPLEQACQNTRIKRVNTHCEVVNNEIFEKNITSGMKRRLEVMDVCMKEKEDRIECMKEIIETFLRSFSASVHLALTDSQQAHGYLDAEIVLLNKKLSQRWRIFGRHTLREEKRRLLAVKAVLSTTTKELQANLCCLEKKNVEIQKFT